MKLLAAGYSRADASRIMWISRSTVRFYASFPAFGAALMEEQEFLERKQAEDEAAAKGALQAAVNAAVPTADPEPEATEEKPPPPLPAQRLLIQNHPPEFKGEWDPYYRHRYASPPARVARRRLRRMTY